MSEEIVFTEEEKQLMVTAADFHHGDTIQNCNNNILWEVIFRIIDFQCTEVKNYREYHGFDEAFHDKLLLYLQQHKETLKNYPSDKVPAFIMFTTNPISELLKGE